MGLVTCVAKHPLGMRDRIYLGKAFRFGSVLFVAAPAEVGDLGQLGHIGDGIVRMFGQGSVAGFATHSRVLSLAMHLGFIFVAGGTLASAGVGNGQRANHVERARPVVSIFPKVLGHHGSAHKQENACPRQQDQPGTNQMSRIPEKATQCTSRVQNDALMRRTNSQPQASLPLPTQDGAQTVRKVNVPVQRSDLYKITTEWIVRGGLNCGN